ncbi:AAA family ATPase [Thiomicrospira sp.]|uniref:AAA family ATPase n=1 Tax=Thiomicrospira sp. TaxID=935 RepID=UPI002600A5FA|nr:AAA family ATPase [Thiomicrospira sp.]
MEELFREWLSTQLQTAGAVSSYLRALNGNDLEYADFRLQNGLEQNVFDEQNIGTLDSFYQRLVRGGDLAGWNAEHDNRRLSAALRQYLDFYQYYKATQNVGSLNDKKALNKILYGPPGTGKTFSTIDLAVSILESSLPTTRPRSIQELKQAYPGQVEFVTFHQSFSYEDFVEGIQAKTDGEKISYEVVDGIFKQICQTAVSKVESATSENISLTNRKVWKMSLGNTLQDEDFIYEECLENDYVLLGWGYDFDFSGLDNRLKIHEKMSKSLGEKLDNNNYAVTSVNVFKNIMQTGDLIVVSDGNSKFRAIAEVTGEYEFLEDDSRSGFKQKRNVKWLRTFSPSLPANRIFDKSLSQMTIYQLKPGTLNVDRFQSLLSKHEPSDKPKPHVLIIDEINRGNISRILGELITLIEPSKRSGNPEAIEVTLPYSKTPFSVPNNLYIIGTMNTADRSLALMDTALRRRFDFIEMMPQSDLVTENLDGVNVRQMLNVMNQRIEALYDREHTLGHAFLMNLNNLDDLRNAFKNKILPLLEEYFYDDWQKIRWVLGAAADNFYQRQTFNNLFTDTEAPNTTEKFQRTGIDGLDEDVFKAIYQGL